MAWSYLPVDRDQRFLLPPDMADWLPEGHLAWFVIDVVDALDLSAFHAQHRGGRGRQAYHPAMMLGLLVYAYCCGVYSSRKIERLCESDAAFRVLCAGHRPDHATIARFRRDHQAQMRTLFVQVLELCRRQGLGEVALVALDGSRVAANASRTANRREDWLRAEVDRMMGEAERVDRAEDSLFGDRRGDEVPEDLGPRGAERVGRLRECLRQMAQDRAARDTRTAEQEAKNDAAAAGGLKRRGRKRRAADPVRAAEREVTRLQAQRDQALARRQRLEQKRTAQGHRPRGPQPDLSRWDERIADAQAAVDAARAARPPESPTADAPGPDDQRRGNTTDPDSRLMKVQGGWVQGFNAQAMVSTDQVVLAAEVTNNGADVTQFGPMLDATQENLAAGADAGAIGRVVADAGYLSEHNLTRPGPDRLICTTKGRVQATAPTEVSPSEPDPDTGAIAQMRLRLASAEGAELYKRRAGIVEPVFGQIKYDRGFRQFSGRGLTAVDAEWKLVCIGHNILKLFGARAATI
jgi:transposase